MPGLQAPPPGHFGVGLIGNKAEAEAGHREAF